MTRTLEELDAIFEGERRAALVAADLVFTQEVAAAIQTVSDINEISNARIMANCQVASAKIGSSAEVQATTLLAAAEALRLKILRSDLTQIAKSETDESVVSELARTAEMGINSTAQAAIKSIQEEAQNAIGLISDNAKTAIFEIKTVGEAIANQIDENAKIAKAKCDEAKASPRTAESIKEAAEDAAHLILEHASSCSIKINKVVDGAIKLMRESADLANQKITETTQRATERIIAARDSALEKIESFLALKKK